MRLGRKLGIDVGCIWARARGAKEGQNILLLLAWPESDDQALMRLIERLTSAEIDSGSETHTVVAKAYLGVWLIKRNYRGLDGAITQAEYIASQCEEQFDEIPIFVIDESYNRVGDYLNWDDYADEWTYVRTL